MARFFGFEFGPYSYYIGLSGETCHADIAVRQRVRWFGGLTRSFPGFLQGEFELCGGS